MTTVSGIGRWTVQGFLVIASGRADVVRSGDLALRRAIERVDDMDHLPSQRGVLDRAERWRPWRSLATAYLVEAVFERDTGCRRPPRPR